MGLGMSYEENVDASATLHTPPTSAQRSEQPKAPQSMTRISQKLHRKLSEHQDEIIKAIEEEIESKAKQFEEEEAALRQTNEA